MRDDVAVALYGYLPPLGGNPRLSYVDHHLFSYDMMDHQSHDKLPDFNSRKLFEAIRDAIETCSFFAFSTALLLYQ